MTLTLCDLGLYTSSTILSILCVNLGYAEKLDDNAARLRHFLNLGPGLVQTHAVQFTVVPDLCVPLTSGHKRNSTFSA